MALLAWLQTRRLARNRDVPGLINALKHRANSVRRSAAGALANLGDTQAVEPLIGAVQNDVSSGVRAYASYALGKIGDPRAVEPLIEALKDEAIFVRINAAEALGDIGDARAVAPLIGRLDQAYSFELRCTAALALGKIGDVRAVKPLIDTLPFSNLGIRVYVCRGLGMLGYTQAVYPLIGELRHGGLRSAGGRTAVQMVAAEALGKIGDVRAEGPLREALNHETKQVRKRAATALALLGDPSASRRTERDQVCSSRIGDLLAVLRAPSSREIPDSGPEFLDELERVRPAVDELMDMIPGLEHSHVLTIWEAANKIVAKPGKRSIVAVQEAKRLRIHVLQQRGHDELPGDKSIKL